MGSYHDWKFNLTNSNNRQYEIGRSKQRQHYSNRAIEDTKANIEYGILKDKNKPLEFRDNVRWVIRSIYCKCCDKEIVIQPQKLGVLDIVKLKSFISEVIHIHSNNMDRGIMSKDMFFTFDGIESKVVVWHHEGKVF